MSYISAFLNKTTQLRYNDVIHIIDIFHINFVNLAVIMIANLQITYIIYCTHCVII